jgi:hypothetical protein
MSSPLAPALRFDLAGDSTDGQLVPSGGTTGGFTALTLLGIVSLSSSGGGLFRRPMTHTGSRGAFFLVGFELTSTCTWD